MASRVARLPCLVLVLVASACTEASRAPAIRRDPASDFRAQLGRRWELARLGNLAIPLPRAGTPLDSPGRDLVPGRRPTITFTSTPSGAGGRSFCNGYGGPFSVSGDSIRITDIVSSAVGCDGPDSLETRFFRALREARRFEIDSATLVLIAADGSRMMFVPADPASSWP